MPLTTLHLFHLSFSTASSGTTRLSRLRTHSLAIADSKKDPQKFGEKGWGIFRAKHMGHLGQVSEKKSVEIKDMISWHDSQAGSNAMLLTGFENKKKGHGWLAHVGSNNKSNRSQTVVPAVTNQVSGSFISDIFWLEGAKLNLHNFT